MEMGRRGSMGQNGDIGRLNVLQYSLNVECDRSGDTGLCPRARGTAGTPHLKAANKLTILEHFYSKVFQHLPRPVAYGNDERGSSAQNRIGPRVSRIKKAARNRSRAA